MIYMSTKAQTQGYPGNMFSKWKKKKKKVAARGKNCRCVLCVFLINLNRFFAFLRQDSHVHSSVLDRELEKVLDLDPRAIP